MIFDIISSVKYFHLLLPLKSRILKRPLSPFSLLLALIILHSDARSLPSSVRGEHVSSVLTINSKDYGKIPVQNNSFLLQTGLKKKKKFNIKYHRRLEQTFPDWPTRMAYQQKQEKFYKSAMKKTPTLKRLKIKENSKSYTKEELDSISYFKGIGIYKQYQDPKFKTN